VGKILFTEVELNFYHAAGTKKMALMKPIPNKTRTRRNCACRTGSDSVNFQLYPGWLTQIKLINDKIILIYIAKQNRQFIPSFR
jgi:hypothetical protein